ncbi:MAG: helix-turn-helix domain-containing protein [Gemmataceae bacterium]
MFTVKQAAQELSLSESLVYKLVAVGKIRHERHGMGRGVIRIPRDSLDEYRQKCTKGEPSVAPVKPAKITRRKYVHLKL